jgi:hypothetical protein
MLTIDFINFFKFNNIEKGNKYKNIELDNEVILFVLKNVIKILETCDNL